MTTITIRFLEECVGTEKGHLFEVKSDQETA